MTKSIHALSLKCQVFCVGRGAETYICQATTRKNFSYETKSRDIRENSSRWTLPFGGRWDWLVVGASRTTGWRLPENSGILPETALDNGTISLAVLLSKLIRWVWNSQRVYNSPRSRTYFQFSSCWEMTPLTTSEFFRHLLLKEHFSIIGNRILRGSASVDRPSDHTDGKSRKTYKSSTALRKKTNCSSSK